MSTFRAQILRIRLGDGEARQRSLVTRADRGRMSALLGAPGMILPGRSEGMVRGREC